MGFGVTDGAMTISREELRDSARKALGGDGLVPDPRESWTRLVEMGWFALTVPEADGGLGLGTDALAAVHIELGRALVPGAAIAQMVAIDVLCAAPDFDGRAELIAAAIGGERIALSLGQPGVTPTDWVADADLAAQLLVVTPDRVSLGAVATTSPRPTWDESRRLFAVEPGTAVLLAEGAAARALHDLASIRLLVALAADAVGGAEAVLEMTVDYLKTRRQFDRPLALFQALKHRTADMKIAVAAAEALLWNRCAGELTPVQAGALKALATTTYLRIAEEAVQLHGGIGLTAEHACHRFLKRAFLDAALGGDADHWWAESGRAVLGREFQR